MDQSIHKNTFIKFVQHPYKFPFFLFLKLPSAFFSGLQVMTIDQNKAMVMVPYKWFSKNPFKSTYFACLAMAAELSTGLLAMMNTHKKNPAISMLVVKLEANYYKKAMGKTIFTCNDGQAIEQAVNAAIATGTGQLVRATSTGINMNGESVADFFITWSFKTKNKIV